jgi:alkanesulfonate monooxygenase SsuD/methylene tetrahydromethanopterin reductase-like flavin-dependent oxidoreductase (luciferase family)
MSAANAGRPKIGVLIPTREAHLIANGARPLLAFAQRAEELGFDSVWAGDSLTARPRVEPIALLAAVAARTSTVTLGTAALTATLRDPVLAAHAIATVDQLAEGRLVLGLGAGFPVPDTEAEFELVGVPFASRITRLVETVAFWRSLWSPDDDAPVALPGGRPGLIDRRSFPQPSRPGGPPLWLAGSGPAALARAGRLFDGWLPYPPTVSAYADGLAAVEQAAHDRGRANTDIVPGLYLTVLVDDRPEHARQMLDTYARAYYGFDADTLMALQAVVIGAPDDCAAAVAGYLSAGARHLVVRIGSLDPEEQLRQLDRLAGTVLPMVRVGTST